MARVKKSEGGTTSTPRKPRKKTVFSVIHGHEDEKTLVSASTKKAAKAAVIGIVTVGIASVQEILQAGRDGQEILEA